ncbi:Cytoplasmic chaperone TorD family protein [Erwinia sp. Ejp617]|nr:molecular chaperone [Erwinia sp. Ejp617]ADP12867.1 Cytoplasmic chaperone TorD family protein [Erwinia sp. Ejp617]
MNEFSIICRLLGSLYNRPSQDALLAPLFTLLREGKLQQHWPLEQDELLTRLQQNCDPQLLADDYHALFVGSECKVPPYGSQWVNGPQEADVRAFLSQRGMPLTDAPTDHIGALLLASSWLEDQSEADEYQAQVTLFDRYLLPWAGAFLGKVEAHAATAFYRTLAAISREAIQAMRDELAEDVDDAGDN